MPRSESIYVTSDKKHRLKLVEADTWPARHKLHKYWGKKPANVIVEYLRAFTQPGDLVLDPFCGCGVSVVEALIEGRNAVGIDLNPIATRITRGLTNPPDAVRLETAFTSIKDVIEPLAAQLYRARCPTCGQPATLLSTVFEGQAPVRVKINCKCSRGAQERPPTGTEERAARRKKYDHPPFPDAEIFWGWQMEKLRRQGLERFSDLFSPRNLHVLAHLYGAIGRVKDPRSRSMLTLTFTANLAQASRMIADYSGAAGGPSWKLNSYWLPEQWQELNVWHYFQNRFQKTRSAMEDMRARLSETHTTVSVYTGDSATCMQRYLAPRSVDFVFTDPPYGGEGIQYGELSMLWNLWLETPSRMEREIAFNPFQDKDDDFYERGLLRTFRATHRVLKPNRWMAVTFNNKDSHVWHALLRACREAGFGLETIFPLKRSAPNITEIHAELAPKADLVLLFQKQTTRVAQTPRRFDLLQSVLRARDRLGRGSVNDIQDLVFCDWCLSFYTSSTPVPPLSRRKVVSTLAQLG